jgi:hypothetical protein
LHLSTTTELGVLNSIPQYDPHPDDVSRFFGAPGDFIEAAAKAAKSEQPRVVVFGEAVALLQAEGESDAAIRFEQLGND